MSYTYEFPRPDVTSVCVVMTKTREPKVLLIEQSNEPFKGCWSLPESIMKMDENLQECAIRALKMQSGIEKEHELYLHFGTFSDVNRLPEGRIVTEGFLLMIDTPEDIMPEDPSVNASWFSINALPPFAFDHESLYQKALPLFDLFMRHRPKAAEQAEGRM